MKLSLSIKSEKDVAASWRERYQGRWSLRGRLEKGLSLTPVLYFPLTSEVEDWTEKKGSWRSSLALLCVPELVLLLVT